MTTVRSTAPARAHFRQLVTPHGAEPIPLPASVRNILGLGDQIAPFGQVVDGTHVTVQDAGSAALCSACIPDADHLSLEQFLASVSRAYEALFVAGSTLSACHPVRMWNFIPQIHRYRGEGLSTYFAFNQARIQAFDRILGSLGTFEGHVPTATGVGHRGSDLVIHLLMTSTPGLHLENPRQIPACRYSSRYGPKPPCFARGTVVRGPEAAHLFVGGTASIRREVSLHPGDLRAQVAETFANLAALITFAGNRTTSREHEGHEPISCLTHVRIYAPDPTSETQLVGEVERRLRAGTAIEFVHAQLCREELLVEIEGVADLTHFI